MTSNFLHSPRPDRSPGVGKRKRELLVLVNSKADAHKTLLTALIYSIFVGTVFGYCGNSDFSQVLLDARDLWSGHDPYKQPVNANNIPYPLPAAFLGMLFAWLPDNLAAGAFLSISIFLLFFFIAKSNQHWRLMMLVSAPFFYCAFFSQFSVLFTSMYFTPTLLPLILIKPHNALPFIFLNKPKIWCVVLTALILALSLAIYPTWPTVWLSQIGQYTGIRSPIAVLPFGPLLLLALFKFRDKRAALLFFSALAPQRMIYDQLALTLVADSPIQLFFLVIAGWIMLIAKYGYATFWDMPCGWHQWVVCTYYLPALLVLFSSELKKVLAFLKQKTHPFFVIKRCLKYLRHLYATLLVATLIAVNVIAVGNAAFSKANSASAPAFESRVIPVEEQDSERSRKAIHFKAYDFARYIDKFENVPLVNMREIPDKSKNAIKKLRPLHSKPKAVSTIPLLLKEMLKSVGVASAYVLPSIIMITLTALFFGAIYLFMVALGRVVSRLTISLVPEKNISAITNTPNAEAHDCEAEAVIISDISLQRRKQLENLTMRQ